MVSTPKVVAAALFAPYWVASSIFKRLQTPVGKPPLFLFGFAKWKTWMADWFPDYDIIFVPNKLWNIEFAIEWRWKILADPRAKVLAWQYKALPQLKDFCKRHGIEFCYVEDGFLRSVALGALRVPPISLTFDSQDMYFNANAPTDMERILATYDFNSEVKLRARRIIDSLLSSGLSKYNSSQPVDINNVYGPKLKKRVLVLGQVERDASIKYGCSVPMNNNDLVWLASRENPDAQIIYKPHPEVLQGTAESASNPDLVRDVALVLDNDITLSDAFQTIDHVYTITSLAGFEALLRGIHVTTVGCPFYSGWGLTDDRQPNPRRTRRLSIEEIFAGAYILYPHYIDLNTKRRIEIEDAISLLQYMKENSPPTPSDEDITLQADEIAVMIFDSTEASVDKAANFLRIGRKERPKLEALLSSLSRRGP